LAAKPPLFRNRSTRIEMNCSSPSALVKLICRIDRHRFGQFQLCFPIRAMGAFKFAKPTHEDCTVALVNALDRSIPPRNDPSEWQRLFQFLPWFFAN